MRPARTTSRSTARTNPTTRRAATTALFPHLLNLFHSQGTTAARGSPHLYRLLEYVQVPSKFVGSETWFNPMSFFGASTSPHSFHPPFNHVSNFRDPGRININTIFDYDGYVWGGIMDRQVPSDSSATHWRE